MTISAFSAARKLCELSNWQISNLKLQKILYFAHMVYMGKNNGAPLIYENFEAWDYGPVVPILYHEAKGYGAESIKMGFRNAEGITGLAEETELTAAWNRLSDKSEGVLIASTHKNGGAWHKNYVPSERGIQIPNNDILQDYKDRINARRHK